MTKDEALDLALKALTPFSTPNWAGTGVDKANEAITAIKQARSAPVQEPVAYLCENAVGHKYFRWKKPSSEFKPIAIYTTPPAQPAPVQERNFCERCGKRLGSGIHTCTPPAAPVQEPDEWLTGCPECGMDSGCDCDSGTWNPPAAQRQWVRLTNEEISQIYLVNTDKPLKADWLFARAIEAKLKELNT